MDGFGNERFKKKNMSISTDYQIVEDFCAENNFSFAKMKALLKANNNEYNRTTNSLRARISDLTTCMNESLQKERDPIKKELLASVNRANYAKVTTKLTTCLLPNFDSRKNNS